MKAAWAKVIQRREDLLRVEAGVGGFGAGEGGGEEHQQREIGGEGVVLLVGGEGEEDEDEGGEDGEQEGGALRVGEVGERLRDGAIQGPMAAIAPGDPGERGSDEDGEELRRMRPVSQRRSPTMTTREGLARSRVWSRMD